MSTPLFVPFVPVPLRARADGWLPAVQCRFLELLAAGLTVGAAAAALGKNRQTAYALRRRKGAESFAAAWDTAAAFAQRGHVLFREKDRVPVPARHAAEEIARRGRDAVFAARDRAAARAAFDEMLSGLYGPKSDAGRRNAAIGKPNFPNLPGGTVAFRSASLRRGRC
jgi:hypothetical protein